VPPHPGPLIAIDAVGANLGQTIAYGLLVAVPTVVIAGPLYGGWIGKRVRPTPPARLVAQFAHEDVAEPAAVSAGGSRGSRGSRGPMEVDDGSGAGGAGGSKKEEMEAFESAMDATFQKFADRVGQNPEQCIRYEFGGTPLLYSKDDAVGKILGSGKALPRCPACGAGRVFEVQLTPQAITELEAEELGLDGMDWGTVIVGVCGRDCQVRGVGADEDGYLEEWVGVQWEWLAKG